MLVSAEHRQVRQQDTPAVDCSDEEFGSIEASLYQVLHRTTANEPLRIVQQKEDGRDSKRGTGS